MPLSALPALALVLAGPPSAHGDGGTPISAERAAALARNRVEVRGDAITVEHELHVIEVGPRGVEVRPRRGPLWQWELAQLGPPRAGVDTGPVSPRLARPDTISYSRGPVREEYLLLEAAVEQRFVIERPLALGGEDLVITGRVTCDGALEKTGAGWRWRGDGGAVRLGDVRVFDRDGDDLAASMEVTPVGTRIVVDGADLDRADYPVTVDPEIGADDFRISHMGPDGDPAFGAFTPAVAYSEDSGRYLVVWSGDDDGPGLADDELEIFGRMLDGSSGSPVGPRLRLSSMGPDGDAAYDAQQPAVAWNPDDDEFLVVWSGDDDGGALVDGELEIFGQRVDAATGAEVGADDFRISSAGPDGQTAFSASWPSVAYAPGPDRWLVVWEGDDDAAPLVVDEVEVFGQLLDASGAEVGPDDFRISDAGDDGSTGYIANRPDVVHDVTLGEFFVVWSADEATDLPGTGEFEIYGQRLDAATGAELGANDLRISDMGPDGHGGFDAFNPAVAWDPTRDQYLVVWNGKDDTGTLAPNEFEVFGQRIDASTGTELDANDFRISTMGPDSNPAFGGGLPDVVYSIVDDEFAVTWRGDDVVDGEFELFLQRLAAGTGAEVGIDDERITDVGPPGVPSFDTRAPALAYDSTHNELLFVWEGDDDVAPLVDGEFEILGQRYLGTLPGITRLYVDANATGENTGTSWADAFHDLQPALDLARVAPITAIWVADGTYRPAPPGGQRRLSFDLVDGVSLLGGFAGGEQHAFLRNPHANVSILSGDLNGDDGPGFANTADNSYHVVTSFGNDATARLDGFRIEGGAATGDSSLDRHIGGGLFLVNASPKIAHCTFVANQATGGGGGLYVRGEPLMGLAASPALASCSFLGNRSDQDGGGAYVVGASFDLVNGFFSGNEAAGNGGGLYNLFGGGFLVVDVVASTFTQNSAGLDGGGIAISAANPRIASCVLWGNTDVSGSGENAQVAGIFPTIDSSCVQGLTGILGGVGNIGLDPQFVAPAGGDGIAGTVDDDARLATASPCIGAGDAAALPADLFDLDLDTLPESTPLDRDGGKRVEGLQLDMGAYEYRDCNLNGAPDHLDVAGGLAVDSDVNTVLDECELILPAWQLIPIDPFQPSTSAQLSVQSPPGGLVLFIWGLVPADIEIPLFPCTIPLGILDFTLINLTPVMPDAGGSASVTVPVQPNLSGLAVLLQAHDPLFCRSSRVGLVAFE